MNNSHHQYRKLTDPTDTLVAKQTVHTIYRREGVYSASGPSREIVSFRSCERAGTRAPGARSPTVIQSFCGTNVFFFVFVVCPRLAFSLVDPKIAQNVSRLMLFLKFCFTCFHIKNQCVFHLITFFYIFAQDVHYKYNFLINKQLF